MSIVTTIETITPLKAAEYLNRNPKNRPISNAAVGAYAAAMSNGEWRLNGEALKFSKEGILLDGQHRLEAVIKSGVTLEFLVIKGISEDEIKTIDIGKRRTAADLLQIHGIKAGNPMTLAAASGFVIDFLSNEYVRNTDRKTPSRVFTFIEKHKGILSSNELVTRDAPKLKGFVPLSVVVAMHYVFSNINQKKADTFFHGLVYGSGMQKGHPVLTLRNKLIFDARDGKRGKENRRRYVALFVKAWDAFIHEEEVPDFRYHPDVPVVLEWNKQNGDGKKAA